MTSRLILGLTTIALCLLLITCGDDSPTAPDPDPPEDPNVASQEIGPDGGEITSQDGNLTLTVPEGALSQPETITIGPAGEEDLGQAFEEITDLLGTGHIYELGPDGLTFDEPVLLRLTSEQSPIQSGDSLGVYAEFLFTSNNGEPELLDSLRTEVDTEEGLVTVSGLMDHFTLVTNGAANQVNNGAQFLVNNIPDMLEINDSFMANAMISDEDTGPLGEEVTVTGPALYEDESSAPIAPAFDGAPATEMDPVPNRPGNFEGSFSYTCTGTGLGVYGNEMRVGVQFELDSGTISAETYANFITTVDCIEEMPGMVTLDLQKDGEGIGTVVSQPEGINCGTDCEQQQADFEEESSVILAGGPANGSVFLGWSGDIPEACEDTLEPCTITMNGNRTVTATFAPSEDFVPNIHEFGGEFTGARSLRLELRVEYELDLSILDGTIDPGDGSGPQDVNLQETDEENEYQGSLDWEYGEDIMYPVMPEATVTDTGSGESESENIEIDEVTITVEKAGDGEGTVIGETGLFGPPMEIIYCNPTCESDSGKSLTLSDDTSTAGLPVLLFAEPADGSAFTGWSGDIDGGEGCEGTGNCEFQADMDRTVTATFESEEPDNTLETGVYTLPIGPGVSSLESFSLLFEAVTTAPEKRPASNRFTQNSAEFGDLTGTFPVAFSEAEQVIVIDLTTEEVLMEINASSVSPLFGVAGIATEPAHESAAFVIYGANGTGDVFVQDGGGTFSSGGAFYDAVPAGGNIFSGTYVKTGFSVMLSDYNTEFGYYAFPDGHGHVYAGTFDDQIPLSAWVPDRPEDNWPATIGVARNQESLESSVYLIDTTGENDPVSVADVGQDARKIRCTDFGDGSGNLLCGVTVFGDDQVAILSWDGETEPTLQGYADVGAGPVNLDLKPLPNGNIGLVTSGFSDNSVTEIELSPQGTILSQNSRQAPAECQSPGHTKLFRDAESLKLIGTCYDSANYFIMESDLQQDP